MARHSEWRAVRGDMRVANRVSAPRRPAVHRAPGGSSPSAQETLAAASKPAAVCGKRRCGAVQPVLQPASLLCQQHQPVAAAPPSSRQSLTTRSPQCSWGFEPSSRTFVARGHRDAARCSRTSSPLLLPCPGCVRRLARRVPGCGGCASTILVSRLPGETPRAKRRQESHSPHVSRCLRSWCDLNLGSSPSTLCVAARVAPHTLLTCRAAPAHCLAAVLQALPAGSLRPPAPRPPPSSHTTAACQQTPSTLRSVVAAAGACSDAGASLRGFRGSRYAVQAACLLSLVRLRCAHCALSTRAKPPSSPCSSATSPRSPHLLPGLQRPPPGPIFSTECRLQHRL